MVNRGLRLSRKPKLIVICGRARIGMFLFLSKGNDYILVVYLISQSTQLLYIILYTTFFQHNILCMVYLLLVILAAIEKSRLTFDNAL